MDFSYSESRPSSKEIVAKLSQLGQIFDQIRQEELSIRDTLRKDCQELRLEVEQIEEKQRKIQDCLKNLQHTL